MTEAFGAENVVEIILNDSNVFLAHSNWYGAPIQALSKTA